MRTLVRWSDSSLSTTTPTPWKAEPSRRMAGPVLHGLAFVGFGLKKSRVDRLEARFLNAEIFEAAVHRHHFDRRFGAHIPVGMQAYLADADLLDAADTRDQRQPIGERRAVGLDIDHVAAAEHLASELGDRTHQRDAAVIEQCDAVAHALHSLEQMR